MIPRPRRAGAGARWPERLVGRPDAPNEREFHDDIRDLDDGTLGWSAPACDWQSCCRSTPTAGRSSDWCVWWPKLRRAVRVDPRVAALLGRQRGRPARPRRRSEHGRAGGHGQRPAHDPGAGRSRRFGGRSDRRPGGRGKRNLCARPHSRAGSDRSRRAARRVASRGGAPVIEPLGLDALRRKLAQAADWSSAGTGGRRKRCPCCRRIGSGAPLWRRKRGPSHRWPA